MLRAMPLPLSPFNGLQVLRLRDGIFTAEQLCALRDALMKNLTALVESDLTAWIWDAKDSPHVAEVVGAVLASGSLTTLNVNCFKPAPDSLHARTVEVLQSHACTLTHMAVFDLLSRPSL